MKTFEKCTSPISFCCNFFFHYAFLFGLLFFICIFGKGTAHAQDVTNCCLKNQSFRLVILGSSTAQGAGATVPDSSWVNRFRTYIQLINPDNEVINLAVGGYTTYRIMPDGFISPPNRHQPDTLKNISQAIRLGADAVLVNMPSNDAATGVPIAEQMQNFRIIIQTAQAAGIPVWITTTQPRNGTLAMRQIQVAMRDSILNAFAPMAIDFWNGLADSINQLNPAFGSGDGVHLNNNGHSLIFNRAIQANILSHIAQVPSGIDLSALEIIWFKPSACGNSSDSLAIFVGNLGGDSLQASVHVTLIVQPDGQPATTTILADSIKFLGACRCDTIYSAINTSPESKLELYAFTDYALDIFSNNDTSEVLLIETARMPEASILKNQFCLGDSGKIELHTTDSILWFFDNSLQMPAGFGPRFSIASTGGPDTLYALPIKPPFTNLEHLQASSAHNIFWNGNMFDLIAGPDTVFIDSLSFIPESSGAMAIQAYFKNGSYLGHELAPQNWVLWGHDSIINAVPLQKETVQFPPKFILPHDTLGVYLHMKQSNRRLGYQSSTAPVNFSQPGLTFSGGTGISYGFGAAFPNRIFAGTFYYRYGLAPLGQCQGNLLQVPVIRVQHQIPIKAVKYHAEYVDLTLTAPNGFEKHLWNTGDTTASIIILASQLNEGDTLNFWVHLTDSIGCEATDSNLVIITSGLVYDEITKEAIALSPNPAKDWFNFSNPSSQILTGHLFDSRGQLISKYLFQTGRHEYQAPSTAGVYYLIIENQEGFIKTLKFVISK